MDTSLRFALLFLGIIIAQLINPTLADDNDDTNKSNSISGKFFEYMNNLRSASPSNSESNSYPSTINSTSTFRKIFLDSSWRETYQKFLEKVKQVRGMLSPPSSSSNGTETSDEPSSIVYNSTQTGLESNRSGRINGPSSWGGWPWTSTSSSSTPRSSSMGLNRVFFGPFERNRGEVVAPVDGYNPLSSYYPAPAPGPGSNLFGRGSPSESHYNYVYKYNPKTQSATDLEQHTTTTIYIICICLVIMLVGTILFAFVSKCQEKSRRTGAPPTTNSRGRRRRRSLSTAANGSNNNETNNNSTSSPQEISIIMEGYNNEDPPAYPKVRFDPPPSYDTLFPIKQ